MTAFNNDDDTTGIIPETQYHTFSEAGNFFKRRSMGELTTLYCNTSSLPKNLEKLERCINSMNTVVDIIAISESKITKTVNVGFENYIKIPNYEFKNEPSLTDFGGVSFFIHSSLNFEISKDLNLGESHLADSLFIEVSGQNISKKCIFGVIYRHQQFQIADFSKLLQPTLNKLQSMKCNYHICGDFNVNAIRYNTHREINELHVQCKFIYDDK